MLNMAESSVVDIESLTTEIESLPIEEDIKRELTSCIQIITGLNHSDDENNNSLSRYNDVSILLNKIAKYAVVALEVGGALPFPVGNICSVIAKIVGFVFSKDIASVVINRFTSIIEADLIAKCRATCTKMAHCITYMQGLPSVDRLQPNQSSHLLQLLASDVPILTGLDEVLLLGEKIKQMFNEANVDKLNTLFEHIQLYCSLATYRELFLLYRYAITSAFSEDTGPVSNVLSAQKENARDVLKFIYKPTRHSIRLFGCSSHVDLWSTIKTFLDRSGLVPDDLSELSGRIFRINPINFMSPFFHVLHERYMAIPNRNYLISLSDDTNNDNVALEFRAVPNYRNVFTIWSHRFKQPKQVYWNKQHHVSVCIDEPPAGTSLWYVLRVNISREIKRYMIFQFTDHRSYFYVPLRYSKPWPRVH